MGSHRNQLRIIAGQWRGRRLSFPDRRGLRPTADRTRETLFNWLASVLPGARCLDLYAGSGALGFEAASRGAARVVMVERDNAAFEALRANRASLGAEQIELHHTEAMRYLAGTPQAFELVFLDPPFDSDELEPVCRRLHAGGWLAPGARIYIETAAGRSPPQLPSAWVPLRHKRAGQVAYSLFQRRDGDSADKACRMSRTGRSPRQ